MKIGIDARMYGAGYGIGRYATEIIPKIIAHALDNQYVIFVKTEKQRQQIQKSIQRQGGEDAQVRYVLANIHWYTLKEQLLFSSILKKHQLDLVHFLHWNIPYVYSGKYVVTIHDLTMFHFARPEATTLGPIKYWIKDRAHRLLIRRIVRKAIHIFTPTQFVAQDLEKTFGNVQGKIIVTSLAPFPKSTPAQEVEAVLNTFNLTRKKYVLYVGAAYPHKNIEAAIAAWRSILQRNPEAIEGYELILAGKQTSFYDRIAESISHIHSIRYIGFVEDSQLEALYAQACAFVFPSLSEGFGIPPLEAMSRNIPVLSSAKSCMPEVLGDAAIYVEVEDPEAFGERILQVIEDGGIRMQAIERGRTQVRQYDWNHCAVQTIQGYKTL